MKFKDTKQFVAKYDLADYIKSANKKWSKNTFGKEVESYIAQASKLIKDFKVTKTTPEYDYIYGADFKCFIGDSTCYCDLKITMKKERLKDVNTFLGESFKLDADYNNMKVIEVSNGLYMCLGVRYERTLCQGTMIYEKPVLVPIVFGNIEKENIINEEFINDFKLLIAFGCHDLEQQGYDKKAKRSFSLIER